MTETIGFGTIASDYLTWDTDTDSGERVANVLCDWASPEINYPIAVETMTKF